MNYRNINEVSDLYTNGILTEKENEQEKNFDVLNDNYPVKYADDITKYTNIFKHIIVFSNNKDRKENKTLATIYDAIDNLKKDKCDIIPEVHAFIASDVDIIDEQDEVTILDDDDKFVISNESNIDTLIISRLGVQNEDQCEHAVQILQDRGFLVLNPVKYSAVAGDKYETALLLDRANIPQPRFVLMTKDLLYDENDYNKAMKHIYKEWDSKNPDKNEKLSFVVKILNGHGGTGVAMIDGKKIKAILQLIFAVSPNLSLILQKKEEADGGDIRVHVLTLRNKQIILAAMKRVKLEGDFRSNVSLGASAEPVKLTEEQEQIALKVAMVSKLPWCAVDIMPLVKGSNPEIGDNVVLEINASPGTEGISDVIEENFINILLNNLTDSSEFMLQDKIAGYLEKITINFGETSKDYLAKLDTGNSSLASHVEVGDYTEDDNSISFTINGKKMKFEKLGESKAIAGDKVYERPFIKVHQLILGQRRIENINFAIVKTRNKAGNVLLNRDVLSKLGYVVHPGKTHILTPEIEKVKII